MSGLAESGNPISWNQYGKPQSHGIAAACNHKHAVIDARVSSKEQEKEGFSIPAQWKLMKDYATTQGFAVAQEYVDVGPPSRRAGAHSARWSLSM